jgi:type I restriction enzyme S subunit
MRARKRDVGHDISNPPLRSPRAIQNPATLPHGWRLRLLSELCDLRTDQTRPAAAVGLRYVGLEHIDSGELTLRRWGSPSEIRSAKTLFGPGDVLYGKLRPYLDKSVIARFSGLCSTDILVLRSRSDVDPEFVAAALHAKPFLDYAIRTMTGINHPRTSWGALGSLAVAVPPLPEQRAIASVLRSVQRTKEACERVIAATRQLKQSLLHYLFAYGPTPLGHAGDVFLQETEPGLMPERWTHVPLVRVAQVRTSTPSAGSVLANRVGPPTCSLPLVKVSDMNHPENRRSIVTAATVFQVDDQMRAKLTAIPEGSIVFPKRGAAIATNKKRLTGRDCLLDPNMAAVVPRSGVDCGYLYAWFERLDLRTITDATTLPQINKKDLERLLVPLPSLPEQLTIASHLSAVDAKLAAEETRLAALDNLFKSLLHHLMTGKVRVNHLVDHLTGQAPGQPAHQCTGEEAS